MFCACVNLHCCCCRQQWTCFKESWLHVPLNELSQPVLLLGAGPRVAFAPDDSGIGSLGAAAGAPDDGSGEASSSSSSSNGSAASAAVGSAGHDFSAGGRGYGGRQAGANPLEQGGVQVMYGYLEAAGVSRLDVDSIGVVHPGALGVNGGCGVVAARGVLLALQQAANLAFQQQHCIEQLSDPLQSIGSNDLAAGTASDLAASFERSMRKLRAVQCPATGVQLHAEVIVWKTQQELLGSKQGARAAVSRIEGLHEELGGSPDLLQLLPRKLQRSVRGRQADNRD
jgi:hypothetical protein